jgi:hypothetical protein
MRFLSDPTLAKGRVIVKQDGEIVAMASSTAMLAVIEHSLRVGDVAIPHPETVPLVAIWIEGSERMRKRRLAEADKKRPQRARRAAK